MALQYLVNLAYIIINTIKILVHFVFHTFIIQFINFSIFIKVRIYAIGNKTWKFKLGKTTHPGFAKVGSFFSDLGNYPPKVGSVVP